MERKIVIKVTPAAILLALIVLAVAIILIRAGRQE